MLERATSCLESGARTSLRRARPSGKHRRHLHAAFWSPNIINFDLPCLAFDTTTWQGLTQQDHGGKDTAIDAAAKGGLLDFLYPPKALAWLGQASLAHNEGWEKRNANRPPQGFVQASRRYSSLSVPVEAASHHPNRGAKARAKASIVRESRSSSALKSGDFIDLHDDEGVSFQSDRTADLHDKKVELPSPSQILPASLVSTEAGSLQSAHPNFKSIKTALAMRLQLTAVAHRLKRASEQEVLATLRSVLQVYDTLPIGEKRDLSLIGELMALLNQFPTVEMDDQIMDMFSQVDTHMRTIQMYKTAVQTYLRAQLLGLAVRTQVEALQRNVSGAKHIAIDLIVQLMEKGQSEFAYDLYLQLSSGNTFADAIIQDSLWQKIRKSNADLSRHIASLTSNLRRYTYDGTISQEGKQDYVQFCLAFYKACVLGALAGKTTPIGDIVVDLESTLFDVLENHMTKDRAHAFLEAMLLDLISPEKGVNFRRANVVIERVLTRWIRLARLQRSGKQTQIFEWLLRKCLDVDRSSTALALGLDHLTTESLIDIWEESMGRVSMQVYEMALSVFANSGNVVRVDAWTARLRALSSRFGLNVNPSIYAYEIHVRAVRRDLTGAMEIFRQHLREAEQSGAPLDVEHQNALVRAYVWTEDVDGARKIMRQTLELYRDQVKAPAMMPLLLHFAANGDIETLAELLLDYTKATSRQPTTQMLVTVVKALLESRDFMGALDYMTEIVVPYSQNPDDAATLVSTYNDLIESIGSSRGIAAAHDVYSRMGKENLQANTDTHAALASVSAAYGEEYERSVPGSSSDNTPDYEETRSYDRLMRGHTARGYSKGVVDAYHKMRGHGLRPSLESERLLLRAQTSNTIYSEHVDKLENRFKAMLREVAVPDNLSPTFLPTLDRDFRLSQHVTEIIREMIPLKALRACVRSIVQYATARRTRWTVKAKLPMSMNQLLMEAYLYHRAWGGVDVTWAHVLSLYDQATDEQASVKPRREEVDLPADGASAGAAQDKHTADAGHDEESVVHSSAHDHITAQEDLRRQLAKQDQPWARGIIQSLPPHDVQSILFPGHFKYKAEVFSGRQPPIPVLAPYSSRFMSKATRLKIEKCAKLEDHVQIMSIIYGRIRRRFSWDLDELNAVIRICLACKTPMLLPAFVLTERYLAHGFPGWDKGSDSRRRIDGADHMDTSSLAENQMFPHFSTLVSLKKAYDAYKATVQPLTDLDDLAPDVAQVEIAAPRTIAILKEMDVIKPGGSVS